MQLNLKAPLVSLQAGEVLTLDDAAGTRIVARSGTVWVTQEGDGKDHIVDTGDVLVLARGGRTVVQALHAAWISLCGSATANEPSACTPDDLIGDTRQRLRGVL